MQVSDEMEASNGKNDIQEIPNWLLLSQKMKRIKIFDNPLQNIPTFHYLSEIDVGNCNLRDLPEDFFCHRLKSVRIDDNKGVQLCS